MIVNRDGALLCSLHSTVLVDLVLSLLDMHNKNTSSISATDVCKDSGDELELAALQKVS